MSARAETTRGLLRHAAADIRAAEERLNRRSRRTREAPQPSSSRRYGYFVARWHRIRYGRPGYGPACAVLLRTPGRS